MKALPALRADSGYENAPLREPQRGVLLSEMREPGRLVT